MVVTGLAVNGEAVDLAPRRSAAAAAAAPADSARTSRHAGSTRRSRASCSARRSPAKSTGNARDRLADEAAGRTGGSGHRMTQRWDDTLFQPTQWFPRVAKYDDLRGWDTQALPRPVGVLQQLRPLRRPHRRARRLDRQRHGRAAEPAGGATAAARERLARVLESDDVITIVGADEVGPGQATAAGRSARLALRRRHGQRLRVGDGEEVTSGRRRARRFPARVRFPSTWCTCRNARSLFANAGSDHAARARVLLEALDAVSVPAAHAAGRAERRHGVPDGDQLEPGRRRSRDRASVVADDGRQQRDVVRLDGRRLQPVHEHPVRRRLAERPRRTSNGSGQSYGRTSGNEDEPPMMWNANYAGSMYGFRPTPRRR